MSWLPYFRSSSSPAATFEKHKQKRRIEESATQKRQRRADPGAMLHRPAHLLVCNHGDAAILIAADLTVADRAMVGHVHQRHLQQQGAPPQDASGVSAIQQCTVG